MAFTFLKAVGYDIGNSLLEEDLIEELKKLGKESVHISDHNEIVNYLKSIGIFPYITNLIIPIIIKCNG